MQPLHSCQGASSAHGAQRRGVVKRKLPRPPLSGLAGALCGRVAACDELQATGMTRGSNVAVALTRPRSDPSSIRQGNIGSISNPERTWGTHGAPVAVPLSPGVRNTGRQHYQGHARQQKTPWCAWEPTPKSAVIETAAPPPRTTAPTRPKPLPARRGVAMSPARGKPIVACPACCEKIGG